MAEVQIIEKANGRIDRRNGKTMTDKLRVSAYCRVSSDKKDQKNSYESQLKYYEDKINSKAEWTAGEIYSDEAISGTLDYKRSGFMNMINDAVLGKFDLLLTKSISRFARNTVDTLKYVRLLKEKNVAILFEEENINTLDMAGELLLTILSSVAQQESETISAHVKLGLKMKMKRGEMVGFNGCLGYDYDPIEKTLSINQEEAKIVRYIFERYSQGIGGYVIAQELTRLGYKTKKGNTKWSDSTVRGILKNEKYKGDLLFGKTFTIDPISHRRLENMGEEDKYYIKDHHEPIISAPLWEKTQEIFAIRGKKNVGTGARVEKYSKKYPFSSLMYCKFCGKILVRKIWHCGSKNQKIIWQCISSAKHSKKNCPNSKGIPEAIIENCFVELYRVLCCNNKELINQFLERTEKALNDTSLIKEIKHLENKIELLESKLSKLLDIKLEGTIEDEIFISKQDAIKQELQELNLAKENALADLGNQKDTKKRISDFKRLFDSNEVMREFDKDVFGCLIDRVVIGEIDDNGNVNPYLLDFVFKSGREAKCDMDNIRDKEVKMSIYNEGTTHVECVSLLCRKDNDETQ